MFALINPDHSPCQYIANPALLGRPVWVKRDDLLHPVVSGNKYRKLKYPLMSLAQTRSTTTPTLVTMGGLWSNHLHATAYAAQACGYHSAGIVRAHAGMNSAMLDDCRATGMQLHLVDRENYRQCREVPGYWQQLVTAPQPFWLPEGGSDPAALHGVAELIAELDFSPDVIMVACGTAATLAGLLAGLQGRSRVVGVAVFKNAHYLHAEIACLLQQAGYPAYQNYDLLLDFDHGGYAKVPRELAQFCQVFSEQSGVPVEPVYTGKVFYALRALVGSGYFQPEEKIMVLHTGGLQGMRGQH